jgi:hypothetical protein
MWTNNAIIRAVLLLAVAASLAAATPVRFSVETVSASSATVTLAISPSSAARTTDRTALFAFSTRPGVAFTAVAQVSIMGKDHTLPVQTLSSGWMGTAYLQWIGIDLSGLPALRPDSLSGSLSIDLSIPVYSGKTVPVLSPEGNILLCRSLPASLSLSKRHAGAPLSSLPFDVGLKMGVVDDGIYQVTYTSLVSSGVPVASIPASRYRLFVKEREVPLHCTAAPASPLKAGDALLFFGERLAGTNSYYTQFSNTNVYWLTWSDTAVGMRIALVSGGQRRDDTQFSDDSVELRATETYDTLHIEKDDDIRWFGNIDNPGEMIETAESDTAIDNWYWGFIGADELTSYPVTLPAPSRTGRARLRVSFMGLTSVESDPQDHQVTVLINNNPAGTNNTATWDGQKPFIFESDSFPAALLVPGENTLNFIVSRRGYQDRCVLNWVELEYPRSFRVAGDRTVFKSGRNAVGQVTQFELNGFTAPTLDLWDIQQSRIFSGFEVRRGTGNDRNLYTLLYQDSIPSPTTYCAQSAAKRRAPEWVKLDTLRGGWDTLGQAEYLVIGPSWARTIVAPLCALHARQGLRAAFVDIDDIYNRFSFGVRDPESIRSMLKTLFAAEGSLRFLLLAGDCTHDLDKKNNGRTLVPTHLSHVPGWGAASDDDYFVQAVGDDQFADACVGRFPAENEEQLATMVGKTIDYMALPSRGFWRDNLLLASGYETEFTAFTNDLSDGVVGPRMNVLRMDADPLSAYYKDELTATGVMANYINQGVYAVNFNGHGGGNIWSDSRFFGYNDLNRLHNGEWGKSGRLPIIFSFTCLTGFFESVFYRSLGEEFIRTNRDGAICFYGASAYTSKKGNLALNRILLDMALSTDSGTVGELVRAAETAMLVQYGPTALPLVRQYNLLGDPALPWRLTPDTLRCTLAKNALTQGDSLSIEGLCAPVSIGSVCVTVGAAHTLWNRSLTTVKKGAFSQVFNVKEGVKTATGMVRAYAWNDSFEVRGWAEFSKDTIMVRDLRVTPATFAFGDTVAISCSLAEPADTAPTAVFCLYAVASPNTANTVFQGVRMLQDSSGRWTTSRSIPLAFADDVNHMLLVYFRVQAGDLSKESGISAFPIAGRPDLTFTGSDIPVRWQDDSLRVVFEVLNKGNAQAPRFDVMFFWGEEPGSDTIGSVACATLLDPGKTATGSFTLPDTQGILPFVAVINDSRPFEEISFTNNRFSGAIRVVAASIRRSTDTLWSRDSGLALVPAREFDRERTLFLFDNPITEARPLQTTSRWVQLRGGTTVELCTGVRPPLGVEDSLVWIFTPDSLPREFSDGATQTASGKLGIMQKDSLLKAWRYAGADRQGTAPSVTFKSNGCGPYALGFLEDIRPPSIQVFVYGKELRFLDYAAKAQPFNILLADPSGVHPTQVSIALNRKPLAADCRSAPPASGDLRNMTVTTYPTSENRIDSLFVTATDLAGNTSESAFAYMPGGELGIKFLSCHPNPFSLRAKGVNGPPQNVRFAFLLVGQADEVTLSVYTVTGKRIWSQRLLGPDLIGYKEIPWNGRDKDAYRIANGTYYAKLSAKSGRKSVKKTIRIAKLEGY